MTVDTDKYFERVEQALDAADYNPHVVAEVTADQFSTGSEEVFAGLDEALELLDGVPVTVRAIEEGSVFDGGPVMEIEGDYRDFARYETQLLGLLSHASGFATAAKRVVDASGKTPVLSFGSRHIHPSLAETMERAAYIGGVDGYSNTAAEDVLPIEASGTMPHALMLSFQKCSQAWRAYDEGVPDDVDRIALVDTFDDETVEALRAARFFGDDLDGIRLDTTGSRRGDFEHIIKEVDAKLKQAGYPDIDIYVSGGLGVEEVTELRECVDGFGVGSAISNADPVDFSLDIVEVEGEPVAKRGKLGGVKSIPRKKYMHLGAKTNYTVLEQARERCANHTLYPKHNL